MRLFGKLNFRTKLNLGITLIVLLIVLPLAAAVSNIAVDALISESKKRGEALTENLADRVEDSMLAMDLLRLKNMVDELASVRDIDYAFIMDNAGHILAQSFSSGFPSDLRDINPVDDGSRVNIMLLSTGESLIYDFAAPVIIAGTRFGTVRVGLSRAQVQATVNQLVWVIILLSATAFMAAILISTIFARRVTWRLNLLRQYAEEVVKGNLDLQTGPSLSRNCWELMDCRLLQCPAHGDTRRRCWYMAGTLCPDCKDMPYEDKIESCRECPVYQLNKGDEIQDLAETFDVMALALRTHISELKSAERVLTRQQQLTRTILDASPDMVGLLDTELRYLAVNEALASFYSSRPAELVGRSDLDVHASVDAEQTRLEHEENARVLASREPLHKEVELGSGPRARWFHVVKLPVTDHKGRLMGLLVSARDISRLRAFQEQLIQAQKMESLGKLAGGVAHEINTPLGVILGYSQLLQEDAEPESQLRTDLGIIENQAKVCRKIVADLLKFSRRSESEKIEMCFNNSLMEVVSLVKHTFSMNKVEIITDLDDRMPIIYGDPDKLKQVWINLLNNARDAMDHGGIIMVRTRLNTIEKTVTCWVADTGSGIPPEDQKRIFDPFFSTKPVGRGTGLGLSVSFGIIEDHQGSIEVQSPVPLGFFDKVLTEEIEPGPGTVFRVDLPLDHEASTQPAESGQPSEAEQCVFSQTVQGV